MRLSASPLGTSPAAMRAGQPLDHRGLAHPGIADEDGVVLAPPPEDLHEPAGLVVAPDHRIQLARRRQRGQIAGVFRQQTLIPASPAPPRPPYASPSPPRPAAAGLDRAAPPPHCSRSAGSAHRRRPPPCRRDPRHRSSLGSVTPSSRSTSAADERVSSGIPSSRCSGETAASPRSRASTCADVQQAQHPLAQVHLGPRHLGQTAQRLIQRAPQPAQVGPRPLEHRRRWGGLGSARSRCSSSTAS